jgi:hypothetical protein
MLRKIKRKGKKQRPRKLLSKQQSSERKVNLTPHDLTISEK